jgi:hypothetical protein
VYTLNEPSAEGTNGQVTMEQVRRIIESKRVPAGKRSHKRKREWMVVSEAVEHGTDEKNACWREMGEEELRRDAQEKEEAGKKAKKRTQRIPRF